MNNTHFWLYSKDSEKLNNSIKIMVAPIFYEQSIRIKALPPNFSTAFSTALLICCSSLTSTIHGKAFPPAASTTMNKQREH